MKALFALSCLITSTAFAGTWTVGVGGGAVRFMDYPGSGHYRDIYLALPYASYRGEKLNVGDGGIGWELFDNDRIKVSFSAGGSLPAGSDDNKLRQGLPELKTLAEIGPKIKVNFINKDGLDWHLNLPFRPVFALDWTPYYAGFNLEPNMSISYDRKRWFVGSNSSISFTSQEIHKNFYQVDAQYATETREQWSAKTGGLMQISQSISAGWRFKDVTLVSSLGLNHYGLSPSADSPLHQADYSLSLATGFVWQIWQSASGK